MDATLDKPYCTVEEVQGIIGNDDASIISRLIDSINQASRLVDEMCGRDFWFHDHSATPYQVVRANVSGRVILLPFEVITLTAMTQDGAAVDMSTVGYEVGSRTIFGQTSWGAYPYLGTITVTGTFGHGLALYNPTTTPPASLPAPIVRATSLIASAICGEWRKERVGIDGDKQSMLETRIPSEATSLLAPYRVRGRAVGF